MASKSDKGKGKREKVGTTYQTDYPGAFQTSSLLPERARRAQAQERPTTSPSPEPKAIQQDNPQDSTEEEDLLETLSASGIWKKPKEETDLSEIASGPAEGTWSTIPERTSKVFFGQTTASTTQPTTFSLGSLQGFGIPNPPNPPNPPSPGQQTTGAMAAVPPVDKKMGIDPPTFTDPREYENWKRTVWTFLTMNSTRYDTDAKRVQYVTTLMQGGEPGQWALTFLDEVLAKPAASTPVRTAVEAADWGMWDKLWTALDAAFADPGKGKTAEQELDDLVQGRLTAEQFFQKFKFLLRKSKANTSDQYRISLLEKKVNPELIKRIYLSKVPTTYDLYKAAVKRHNNLTRTLKHVVAHATNKSYEGRGPQAGPSYVPPGKAQTYGGKGQPMDMSAMINKPSKKDAFEKGLCFICGNLKHRSNKCPYRKKQDEKKLFSFKKKKNAIRAMYGELEEAEQMELLEGFLEL